MGENETRAKLTAAMDRLAKAEAVATNARRDRDVLIREALDNGWTMYRVAKHTGLSRPAVRAINDKTSARA
jgi:hypothetical protein